MDSHSLSLSFELRIIRARNLYLKSSRDLFIRCYLPSAGNKRVRLDSQQIPSNSDLIWDQTFSLDCSGSEATIKSLKQGSIVFELRSRNTAALLARMSGSKLLARAEMPLNDVVEAPNMEVEKWAVMIAKSGDVYSHDVKPPAVQIAMKVAESAGVIGKKKKDWDGSCGCVDRGSNNSCVGYEYFALEAVLEAF